MVEDSRIHSIILDYLDSSRRIIDSIVPKEIEKLALQIFEVRDRGGMVFIAGNGGSASTASHFATDLGVGTLKITKPVRAISLTDNAAVTTAVSNDLDFESVFQQQIQTLGKPGDLLVLFSASGNSKNLLSAQKRAKDIGLFVFSVTGFDGGELRKLTLGNNVHVPSQVGEYGLVEDAHLAICHMVTECIRVS